MRTIDELWKRYYINAPLIDRPLVELDEYTLDTWVHSLIKRHSMTKQQYYNMAIIIRRSLDLAVKKGIVQGNAFNNFRIDYKLFKPMEKKADETQVFLTDEQPLIEQEAYRDFEQSGKTACLAIPLAFQTGLRMSELVALRWSDINEKMGYDNNGYIFLNEKGRVTAPSLNKRILRYCRKIGISKKVCTR